MKSSAELLSLRNRRVLITGAASGIGAAMAQRFAEAGADLILLDVNREALEETAGDARAFGTGVSLEVIDLQERDQIASLWERLGDEAPDTLVNNAGIYPMRDFLKVDETFLERVLRVNLESALWMCQGFIAQRLKKGGVIVNVASIEAVLPFKDDLVPYSVSKAGIIALTRSLARDYGRRGFRVNVLLPGVIRTRSTESLARSAIRGLQWGTLRSGYIFQSRLSLGRWGRPDEVARAALFLVSDLASYIQGAMLPVDGGYLSS